VQRLYSAANLPEAHLVRGLLSAAGIEARVFNEYAGGALGELPFAEVAPTVWIEEEHDLARARQVIASYEKPAVVPGSTHCRTCGEENPLVFSICWQCQRPLY
jgi:hypothetical protein